MITLKWIHHRANLQIIDCNSNQRGLVQVVQNLRRNGQNVFNFVKYFRLLASSFASRLSRFFLALLRIPEKKRLKKLISLIQYNYAHKRKVQKLNYMLIIELKRHEIRPIDRTKTT